MAKAVSNKQDKSGKGKANGKTGKDAKALAKRADARPARKRARPQPARASRSAGGKGGKEKRGFGRFLHDVRIEMGKVTWPTRNDLLQSTLVVLVAVVIAAAYTGAVDYVFSAVVDLILNVIT